MHAHEPCAPPVVPSTRAGPAAFGVHVAPPMVKHHEEAPQTRAFEGVGAMKQCGIMLSGLVGCLVDVKVMVRLVIMMVVGVGPTCGGVLLRGRQAGGVRAPRRAGSLVSVSAMPSSLPPLCSAWAHA